jgi:hypothetical protein
MVRGGEQSQAWSEQRTGQEALIHDHDLRDYVSFRQSDDKLRIKIMQPIQKYSRLRYLTPGEPWLGQGHGMIQDYVVDALRSWFCARKQGLRMRPNFNNATLSSTTRTAGRKVALAIQCRQSSKSCGVHKRPTIPHLPIFPYVSIVKDPITSILTDALFLQSVRSPAIWSWVHH